jgi:hypothetical protein
MPLRRGRVGRLNQTVKIDVADKQVAARGLSQFGRVRLGHQQLQPNSPSLSQVKIAAGVAIRAFFASFCR